MDSGPSLQMESDKESLDSQFARAQVGRDYMTGFSTNSEGKIVLTGKDAEGEFSATSTTEELIPALTLLDRQYTERAKAANAKIEANNMIELQLQNEAVKKEYNTLTSASFSTTVKKSKYTPSVVQDKRTVYSTLLGDQKLG